MGDEAALAPGRRLFLSSWRQVFAAPVPPFSGSMKPTRRAGGAAPDAVADVFEGGEGRALRVTLPIGLAGLAGLRKIERNLSLAIEAQGGVEGLSLFVLEAFDQAGLALAE